MILMRVLYCCWCRGECGVEWCRCFGCCKQDCGFVSNVRKDVVLWEM